MDKLLIFNTKYKKHGGEDSNIQDELKFYKNYYDVSYFEVKNSKFNLYSILSLLVSNNFEINRKLSKELKTFKPKYVYVHNTWFNAGLGVFRIFSNQNIVPIVKIHNFRFACTDTFSASKHFNNKELIIYLGLGLLFAFLFDFLKIYFAIILAKLMSSKRTMGFNKIIGAVIIFIGITLVYQNS